MIEDDPPIPSPTQAEIDAARLGLHPGPEGAAPDRGPAHKPIKPEPTDNKAFAPDSQKGGYRTRAIKPDEVKKDETAGDQEG